MSLEFKNGFLREVVDIVKHFSQARYNQETKQWILPLSEYDTLCKAIASVCIQNSVQIVDIPGFVRHMSKLKQLSLKKFDYQSERVKSVIELP